MHAPKNNNNLNCYHNNSIYNNYDLNFDSDYNILIYFSFIISCIFNLKCLIKKIKKNKIKNTKKYKNFSIQTDTQFVSLLINPDNDIQIMNNYNQ